MKPSFTILMLFYLQACALQLLSNPVEQGRYHSHYLGCFKVKTNCYHIKSLISCNEMCFIAVIVIVIATFQEAVVRSNQRVILNELVLLLGYYSDCLWGARVFCDRSPACCGSCSSSRGGRTLDRGVRPSLRSKELTERWVCPFSCCE